MKILAIEDDRSTQELLKKILEPHCDLTVVGTAIEGINLFTESLMAFDLYDVILLDIGLPDMGGIEALHIIRVFEKVKSISPNRRVKIIMMTADADEQKVKQSLQNGCDNFLIKPISKDKLQAKFNAISASILLVPKKSPGSEEKEE